MLIVVIMCVSLHTLLLTKNVIRQLVAPEDSCTAYVKYHCFAIMYFIVYCIYMNIMYFICFNVLYVIKC